MITETNKLYCGDSLTLIKELGVEPSLVIMSPPDQAETNMSFGEYTSFIHSVYNDAFDKLKDGGVLVSITTDRKHNGAIYLKHEEIINALKNKATLFNYKIWAKSLKTNLYILNFCHMLFFCKGKKPLIKNNISEFYPDVWLLERDKIKNYPSKDSFPSELVKRLVLTFTNTSDLIFDPFVGSGKTAKVAVDNDRKFIGFDSSQEFIDIANRYIEDSLND